MKNQKYTQKCKKGTPFPTRAQKRVVSAYPRPLLRDAHPTKGGSTSSSPPHRQFRQISKSEGGTCRGDIRLRNSRVISFIRFGFQEWLSEAEAWVRTQTAVASKFVENIFSVFRSLYLRPGLKTIVSLSSPNLEIESRERKRVCEEHLLVRCRFESAS